MRAGSEIKVSRSMWDVFSPRLNHFVKSPTNHTALAARYAFAMDVAATRLYNLRLLVTQLTQGGGTKKQAAHELDMSGSFLSQLLGGKKMGDDVARKIEVAQGLDRGWMDHRQWEEGAPTLGEPPRPAYLSQPQRLSPEILAASIKLIRLTFANLGFEHDPEDDAAPLVYAYEYLLDCEQHVVTPENLVDFSKKLAERLRERGNDNEQSGKPGGVGGSDRRESQRHKAGQA